MCNHTLRHTTNNLHLQPLPCHWMAYMTQHSSNVHVTLGPDYRTILILKPELDSSDFEIRHTGELGYRRLNGARKIGPSYAKSVIYIRQLLDMHGTGTKHIVRHSPSYNGPSYPSSQSTTHRTLLGADYIA